MSPAADAAGQEPPEGAVAAAVARGRNVTFGFIPALDGLRALAVLGVMMYHGGVPILGGGFLTIDVFFVLSGFLITSLLVGEWRKKLTIHLGQFWARRARRLLPALLVMLIAVAIYAKVFAPPGEFANLRLDSLSTLFYVANWHFIFAGTNYFNLTAHPSPLNHMWSLSIEEQFYIVWPPVVLAMLWVGNKLRPARRLWPVFAVAVAGAVASALDMGLLYHGPQSVMRVYEGTDTRSQDMLVGAALAIGMAIWAQHRKALPADPGSAGGVGRGSGSASGLGSGSAQLHRRDRIRQQKAGVTPIPAWELPAGRWRTALGVLGWVVIAVFAYAWSHMSQPTTFLYRGGFFLVAVGVALVIFTAVTHQLGSVSRALGIRPFQYVGKISYGTYLWHFPLFAMLSATSLHLIGYPLLVIRIGVTLLVATISFYVVEEPIRRGRMRSLTEWRAWLMTSGAVFGVVAVTVLATLPSAADAAPASLSRPSGSQYNGPTVKLAVFGDSVASRLGLAMSLNNLQQSYDVDLENDALVGCGVVRSTQYIAHGVANLMAASCNSSTPASQQWPAQWSGDLAQFHPNVVAVLVGRWEINDRLINGQWMHIGEPAYDTILRQSLEQAVNVAGSTGAQVVLMTAPCFDSGEQDNGQPWPEDSATRLSDYNTILRQVGAEHPTNTEVFDLGSLVCPGGHFALSVDGVQLRDADGIHIVPTDAAGQWLDARVLPEVVRLGRLQMAHPGQGSSSSSGVG
ncbi:MAG TPA: acyltransferase family protein [Acidimicrobiales bacterium]|jgi:peptidoglycan/LPS O-acetylase OafA/YrhL|nr:acyltransferase family protein [Acidimicrobiales bacterium]